MGAAAGFRPRRRGERVPWRNRVRAGPRGWGGSWRSTGRGSGGKTPEQPVSVEELEREAGSVLSQAAYDYVAGGAGSEDTMRANLEAFRRCRIVPRYLRDVSRRDLGVELLGAAPAVADPAGADRRAGRSCTRTPSWPSRGPPRRWESRSILSTVSSTPMEQVAAEMGEAPRWFQLYWPRSDELAASFVGRAEQRGLRRHRGHGRHVPAGLARARHPQRLPAVLPRRRPGQLLQRPGIPAGGRRRSPGRTRPGPSNTSPRCSPTRRAPGPTWSGCASATRLPILVKGVLHPDDARKAVDHGAAGVIVSNHGGRQLDGAIAALDALPRVVDAVGDRTTVLFDSGIRRGSDVLKAARAGRPGRPARPPLRLRPGRRRREGRPRRPR